MTIEGTATSRRDHDLEDLRSVLRRVIFPARQDDILAALVVGRSPVPAALAGGLPLPGAAVPLGRRGVRRPPVATAGRPRVTQSPLMSVRAAREAEPEATPPSARHPPTRLSSPPAVAYLHTVVDAPARLAAATQRLLGGCAGLAGG